MRMTIRAMAAVIFGATFMVAGPALAQCGSGCLPPPPPSPPPNPGPPNMPGHGCGGGGCGGGGGGHHHGGGRTNVNVNVNVNASGSGSGSGSGSVYYGGGYGNWSQTPGYPSSMPLNVMTLAPAVTQQVETWQDKVTTTKTMMLQAVCLDSKGAPHPASQVFGHRDVEGSYVGELYRCIAGTYLQVTMVEGGSAQYTPASFNGGKVLTCAKGDALYFNGGEVSCRKQAAARSCNERSLLRRFGVGIKVVTMTVTEVVTRTRQSAQHSQSSRYQQSAGHSVMVFDGGVGGFVQ